MSKKNAIFFAQVPLSLSSKVKELARRDEKKLVASIKNALDIADKSLAMNIWHATSQKYAHEVSKTVRIPCDPADLRRMNEIMNEASVQRREVTITTLHFAFKDSFSPAHGT